MEILSLNVIIIQAALFILLLALNISGISEHSMIAIIAAALFTVYVCICRCWQFLQCGVLFSIISLGPNALAIPILSQAPAVGILLMVVVSFLIISPFKKARNWSSWAKAGKITTTASLSIVAISIISSFALIAWAHWTDHLGIALKMAEGVQYYPKLIIFVVFIPCFASVNALMEETVYRGVLQHALTEVFKNKHLVVLMQASAFAAFHYAVGFPNGWLGYGLTLLYGTVLGYLKDWTQGLLAPWLCHLIADMTIYYYMADLVLG